MSGLLQKLGITHPHTDGAAKENSNRVAGPAPGQVGYNELNQGQVAGHTAAGHATAGHHSAGGHNPNLAGPNPTTVAAPGANESYRGVDNSAQVRTGAAAENVGAQAPLGYAGQPLATGATGVNTGMHTGAHTGMHTGAHTGVAGAVAGAVAGHHHEHHTHHATGMHTGVAHTGVATGAAVNHTGIVDDAMTRSEERLLVSKQAVHAGEAAIHKTVTTEHVETAVPVMRERAVLEREPITDANRAAAMSGPAFKEAHYEVALSEERAVAEKEAVAVERIRLRKEQEVGAQYVGADLRKEHIEFVDATKPGVSGVNTMNTVNTTTHTSGVATEKRL